MEGDREDSVVERAQPPEGPEMAQREVEQIVGRRTGESEARRGVRSRGRIDERRPVTLEHRTEQFLDERLRVVGPGHEALM